MTLAHPCGCRCVVCGCRCVVCDAAAALLLIESGRPALARPLLAGLVLEIPEALGQAFAKGHDAAVTATSGAVTKAKRELRDLDDRIARARRELASLERKRSAHAEWLTRALATGRITVERVAEVLNVQPEDVPPIAEGRVGLAVTAWRRLMGEIGG
jgi:hypothetical protein